jgi:hypothetical protein
MPSPVETILTSVGIPAEEVSKIISLPQDEADKFDANPYLEKVKGNYQTQFKNDPAFFSDITLENLSPDVKKKLEGGQFARAANIVKEKFIKALGMTEADYSDLPEDQRKELDSFIPAIAERYTKTKAGDKQLQQDLIEARKQLEKYGPDYEKGIEQKHQTAADQKVTAAIFNANLISELSGIQGLKIAAGDIAKTANDILASKYAFERVGEFGVELRQKDNPQMKVLKTGSSQQLTLKDALTDIATERGWIEKKQEGQNGSGTVRVTPTNDGLKAIVPPHLQDRISSKIAAEKQ